MAGKRKAYHALTEEGAESLRLSTEALRGVADQFLDWTPVFAPYDERSIIDGFCIDKKTKEVVGMFEAKTRFHTVEEFKTRFHNKWLLSHDKIYRARVMTEWLHLPFWAFLYMAPSKIAAVARVWNADNGTEVRHNVAQATTSKNIKKVEEKVTDCCLFQLEDFDFYDLTDFASDMQIRPARH